MTDLFPQLTDNIYLSVAFQFQTSCPCLQTVKALKLYTYSHHTRAAGAFYRLCLNFYKFDFDIRHVTKLLFCAAPDGDRSNPQKTSAVLLRLSLRSIAIHHVTAWTYDTRHRFLWKLFMRVATDVYHSVWILQLQAVFVHIREIIVFDTKFSKR